jgi:hypothetical protein
MNPIAYTLYRFKRTKYIAEKEKFIADNTDYQPYEALILWLDFKDILTFFKLDGKIFLGWDKTNNRYRAFILSEPTTQTQIRILRRGENIRSIEDKNETLLTSIDEQHFIEPKCDPAEVQERCDPAEVQERCDPAEVQEAIDDDMDKLYIHMQGRLMAVAKQLYSL